MTNEEMEIILLAQQEAIALLRAGQVQIYSDIDELRAQQHRQSEHIAQAEYAITQIERRLDNRS